MRFFLLRKAISNVLSDEPNATIEYCPTKVTEGDNATLSCNARGSPTPETAWIREKQARFYHTVRFIR